MFSRDAPFELVVLVDSEELFLALARDLKSAEPSRWRGMVGSFFGAVQKPRGDVDVQAVWHEPGTTVREVKSNGTGFTWSRRFDVGGCLLNLLYLKPESGHLLGWLTMAELSQRVRVGGLLCISRSISLREDLRRGELALVTCASAVPYPALYASRPPVWQDSEADEPDGMKRVEILDENLILGRDIVQLLRGKVPQEEILEIESGYAVHPAWAGGKMPWAKEQFAVLRENGLDTMSELAVGALDFAERYPTVPVVCFSLIYGAPQTGSAGDLARYGGESGDFGKLYGMESRVFAGVAIQAVSAFLCGLSRGGQV